MYTIDDQWARFEIQIKLLSDKILAIPNFNTRADYLHEVKSVRNLLTRNVMNKATKSLIQKFCTKHHCYLSDIRVGMGLGPVVEGVFNVNFDIGFIFNSMFTRRVHNLISYHVTNDNVEISVGRDGLATIPHCIPQHVKIPYVLPPMGSPLSHHLKNIVAMSSKELSWSQFPKEDLDSQYFILKNYIKDVLALESDENKNLQLLSTNQPEILEELLNRIVLVIEGISNGQIEDDVFIAEINDIDKNSDVIRTSTVGIKPPSTSDTGLLVGWISGDRSTKIDIIVYHLVDEIVVTRRSTSGKTSSYVVNLSTLAI